ncbi:hypothetical protein LR002_00525, partial [Candidatus Gracilibacteria bacterium]|nr:hypothetical protein [Candidatus Gracilibacteria bacterium]
MNKKITFFDKIFSFRESVIRQYIENELSDYTDQINFKKDIIRRHWMFFFLKSFHIFLLIGFFIFALSFILKYQSFLHQTLLKGNYGINLTIGFLSSLIIFGFIIYIIKAKLINKIGIFIGFF